MFVATQTFDIAGAIENRQNPVPKLVNSGKESYEKIEGQISREIKGRFPQEIWGEKASEKPEEMSPEKTVF